MRPTSPLRTPDHVDAAIRLLFETDADSVKATVTLAKPITNGPNYDVTFDFEKAGSVSVAVPISAPEGPRQNEPPAPA